MSPQPITIPHLTLVLGGTRSGKSAYAESQATSCGPNVLYIATAEVWPGNGSMEERIRRHRARRPASWATFECPRGIGRALAEQPGMLEGRDAALLDCMTLLLTNLMATLDEPGNVASLERAAMHELDALLDTVAASEIPWYIVSAEAGLGLIAPDPGTRAFCDVLGLANQRLAASAGRVVLTVAGLPLALKGMVE